MNNETRDEIVRLARKGYGCESITEMVNRSGAEDEQVDIEEVQEVMFEQRRMANDRLRQDKLYRQARRDYDRA